eukprot:scaffold235751_cov24-Tisochrysis_lutea.AAC.1
MLICAGLELAVVTEPAADSRRDEAAEEAVDAGAAAAAVAPDARDAAEAPDAAEAAEEERVESASSWPDCMACNATRALTEAVISAVLTPFPLSARTSRMRSSMSRPEERRSSRLVDATPSSTSSMPSAVASTTRSRSESSFSGLCSASASALQSSVPGVHSEFDAKETAALSCRTGTAAERRGVSSPGKSTSTTIEALDGSIAVPARISVTPSTPTHTLKAPGPALARGTTVAAVVAAAAGAAGSASATAGVLAAPPASWRKSSSPLTLSETIPTVGASPSGGLSSAAYRRTGASMSAASPASARSAGSTSSASAYGADLPFLLSSVKAMVMTGSPSSRPGSCAASARRSFDLAAQPKVAWKAGEAAKPLSSFIAGDVCGSKPSTST